MRLPTLFGVIGLFCFYSGCAFDGGAECEADAECVSGACVTGQCVPESPADGADLGSIDASDPADEGNGGLMPDDGSVDPGTSEDAGEDGDLSEPSRDMDVVEPDSGQPSSCAYEEFGCTNDQFEPNHRFPHELPPTAGCTVRDDVVTKSETLQGVLCPQDVDLFSFLYVECDSRTLSIRVRVTPTIECGHDAWSLSLGGAECTDERVRCTEEPDGSKEIQMLVPARQSPGVWSARVQISSDHTIRMPYTMAVEVN